MSPVAAAPYLHLDHEAVDSADDPVFLPVVQFEKWVHRWSIIIVPAEKISGLGVYFRLHLC